MLSGLHHITLISSDLARTTRFCSDVLGLHLVKQTVNFDDPAARHFYFGDQAGTPGTVVTYFEWPQMPPGATGVGLIHHYAFVVEDEDALARWWVRLRRLGIETTNPRPRRYFTSIYFRDPDGAILEIATRGPGFLVDEPEDALGERVIVPPRSYLKPHRPDVPPRTEHLAYDGAAIEAAMRLQGIHHVTLIAADIERTTWFYTDLLGQRLLKRTVNFDVPDAPHYYYGDRLGRPGTVVTYFGFPQMARGRLGVGTAHHVAYLVETDEEQRVWQERLRAAGVAVTDVIDRRYFRSIYFTDPDGAILEIATRGPGFLVDEDPATLGSRFITPEWLPVSPARN
ncbi:MAG TPA: VOC family protein [bacterium]|nr:VOC family protein [bacterium]